ncbi:uncharacterized protein V1518DRAFT_407450 [Limtongia smithiae]|uniref:uncharacterized protein n=1 Tax=Limtongia smithiae TaxID=1125753 RepID=UPI0034D01476
MRPSLPTAKGRPADLALHTVAPPLRAPDHDAPPSPSPSPGAACSPASPQCQIHNDLHLTQDHQHLHAAVPHQAYAYTAPQEATIREDPSYAPPVYMSPPPPAPQLLQSPHSHGQYPIITPPDEYEYSATATTTNTLPKPEDRAAGEIIGDIIDDRNEELSVAATAQLLSRRQDLEGDGPSKIFLDPNAFSDDRPPSENLVPDDADIASPGSVSSAGGSGSATVPSNGAPASSSLQQTSSTSSSSSSFGRSIFKKIVPLKLRQGIKRRMSAPLSMNPELIMTSSPLYGAASSHASAGTATGGPSAAQSLASPQAVRGDGYFDLAIASNTNLETGEYFETATVLSPMPDHLTGSALLSSGQHSIVHTPLNRSRHSLLLPTSPSSHALAATPTSTSNTPTTAASTSTTAAATPQLDPTSPGTPTSAHVLGLSTILSPTTSSVPSPLSPPSYPLTSAGQHHSLVGSSTSSSPALQSPSSSSSPISPGVLAASLAMSSAMLSSVSTSLQSQSLPLLQPLPTQILEQQQPSQDPMPSPLIPPSPLSNNVGQAPPEVSYIATPLSPTPLSPQPAQILPSSPAPVAAAVSRPNTAPASPPVIAGGTATGGVLLNNGAQIQQLQQRLQSQLYLQESIAAASSVDDVSTTLVGGAASTASSTSSASTSITTPSPSTAAPIIPPVFTTSPPTTVLASPSSSQSAAAAAKPVRSSQHSLSAQLDEEIALLYEHLRVEDQAFEATETRLEESGWTSDAELGAIRQNRIATRLKWETAIATLEQRR